MKQFSLFCILFAKIGLSLAQSVSPDPLVEICKAALKTDDCSPYQALILGFQTMYTGANPDVDAVDCLALRTATTCNDPLKNCKWCEFNVDSGQCFTKTGYTTGCTDSSKAFQSKFEAQFKKDAPLVKLLSPAELAECAIEQDSSKCSVNTNCSSCVVKNLSYPSKNICLPITYAEIQVNGKKLCEHLDTAIPVSIVKGENPTPTLSADTKETITTPKPGNSASHSSFIPLFIATISLGSLMLLPSI